jgi:hypothetical protein
MFRDAVLFCCELSMFVLQLVYLAHTHSHTHTHAAIASLHALPQ